MLPIIIFVLFVGTVIGLNLYTNFNNAISLPSATANIFPVFDYGMVFLVVGLIIGALVFAYYIPSHPLFLVFGIMTLMIILLISPSLTNSFMQFASSSELVSYSNQLPVSLQIMGNIPLVVFVAGILILIALYIKPMGGGEA